MPCAPPDAVNFQTDAERFHLLVDAVTDYAIYMLDRDDRIITSNAGAERLKGYTDEEVIGQHFWRLFLREDQQRNLPAQILDMATTRGRHETEGWRVRKDGTKFWALEVIHKVQDKAGRHIGFAKVTRDITERKAAQDALLESERRFRILVQGITDYAIYMLDPSGIITNWNVGAERINRSTSLGNDAPARLLTTRLRHQQALAGSVPSPRCACRLADAACLVTSANVGPRLFSHLANRMIVMRAVALALVSLVTLAVTASAQTRIDAINTNFRWLGPDDKIVVERYDDPKVANVSCYMSRAETGGIKGGLGFAEDPSRFSVACRATGPIAVPPGLRKSEVIAFASASLFFKTFEIHRAVDAEKNVLVYTVVSTKLINGSPFNSISVVPVEVR